MTGPVMVVFGLFGVLGLAFIFFLARHVDVLDVLKMRVKSLEAYILDVDNKVYGLRKRIDYLGREYSQKYADAERDMVDAMGGFELGEQLSDNEKLSMRDAIDRFEHKLANQRRLGAVDDNDN